MEFLIMNVRMSVSFTKYFHSDLFVCFFKNISLGTWTISIIFGVIFLPLPIGLANRISSDILLYILYKSDSILEKNHLTKLEIHLENWKAYMDFKRNTPFEGSYQHLNKYTLALLKKKFNIFYRLRFAIAFQ